MCDAGLSAGTVRVVRRRRNNTPRSGAAGSAAGWVPSDGGMLRSGLDEPEELPVQFEALLERFGVMQTRWDRGEITAQQFAEELARLIVLDSKGNQWTVGARSRQWYRRAPDGGWVPSAPPAAQDEPRIPDWQMVENPDEHDLMPPVATPTFTGRIVEEEPVWGEVQDTASTEDLPEFSTTNEVLDEHGVWDSTFSTATERGGVEPSGAWGLMAELEASEPDEDLGLPPELFEG